MNIIVKLKKAGSRLLRFSISDNLGNLLSANVSKSDLISGVALSVDDNVTVITITSLDCCSKSINIPISEITLPEITSFEYNVVNTSSIWTHLVNPTIYNTFYGCVNPYIIEYPFSYQYQDEIVQNVIDYTKVYRYLPSDNIFDVNAKIETNDKYFNKAVLYNSQQSSGILNLVAKPVNNLKEYLTYPKYNTDSKTITFTKSDNFYQYNTFWSIAKDSQTPLFKSSCESLSIDKEVNQDNMNYTNNRSFTKAPLRAKDLKIRHILDNNDSIHLVSQFIIAPSQLSYK